MQFKNWLEHFSRWQSTDGTVSGDLEINDEEKEIAIRDWRSSIERQGNTIRALQQLRSDYPNYKITVLAAIPESQPYWQKMKEQGLVDNVFTDCGKTL